MLALLSELIKRDCPLKIPDAYFQSVHTGQRPQGFGSGRCHSGRWRKFVDFDSFGGGPRLPIVKDVLGMARKASTRNIILRG